jgi:hypothetical protein
MFPEFNGEWDSMLEDETKSKIDPAELSFY